MCCQIKLSLESQFDQIFRSQLTVKPQNIFLWMPCTWDADAVVAASVSLGSNLLIFNQDQEPCWVSATIIHQPWIYEDVLCSCCCWCYIWVTQMLSPILSFCNFRLLYCPLGDIQYAVSDARNQLIASSFL